MRQTRERERVEQSLSQAEITRLWTALTQDSAYIHSLDSQTQDFITSFDSLRLALIERKKALQDSIAAIFTQLFHQDKPSIQDRIAHALPLGEESSVESKLDSTPTPPPQGWEMKTLGEICEKITDGTHKTPKYELSGVPFLSIQNISKGYFDLSSVKYISYEEHIELAKRCEPKLNDILFCRIGTLGKAIKNTLNFEFSIFVSLALIRLKDKSMADYVVNVLNCGYIVDWINQNKVDGVHTSKINLNTLKTLPIPLPPLAVQEQIVTQVGQIEAKIATTKQSRLELERELECYLETRL